jgi:hypothetical protein
MPEKLAGLALALPAFYFREIPEQELPKAISLMFSQALRLGHLRFLVRFLFDSV